MSKITLLYHPNEHSNFTAVHLEPYWKKFFDLEPIDITKTYNSRDVVLVSKHLNQDRWFEPWQDQGFKIIIDHYWDNDVFCSSSQDLNVLTARAPNWAWINESIWYKHLRYNDLTFERNVSKFFLTLMRLKKQHRTMLFDQIKKFSDISLISYVAENIFINGDCDRTDDLWQRYVNVDWYNSTSFSLVAETQISPPIFVSEKTFKPMAFKHPFLIWGSAGTLNYLHKHGFETFDHVIDESYDTVIDHSSRLKMILNQVDHLYHYYNRGLDPFNDTVTREKIQHNFNHFYDPSLVEQMLLTEVVDPIRKFVCEH